MKISFSKKNNKIIITNVFVLFYILKYLFKCSIFPRFSRNLDLESEYRCLNIFFSEECKTFFRYAKLFILRENIFRVNIKKKNILVGSKKILFSTYLKAYILNFEIRISLGIIWIAETWCLYLYLYNWI